MRNTIKKFIASLQRGRRFITHDVWHIGLPGEEIPNGLIIKQIRIFILLMRGIVEETLLLRASALTFATLLFIVPFLVFVFSFIQAFNLGDHLYYKLSERADEAIAEVASFFRENVQGEEAPAEEEAPAPPEDNPQEYEALPLDDANTAPLVAMYPVHDETVNNELLQKRLLFALFPIFSSQYGNSLLDEAHLENPVKLLMNLAHRGATNPQTLGITGILFILSTVFGFMRNVEFSFNRIWGVQRSRSLFRTVSDYMMVTLLLPFAMSVVLGIMAVLESQYIADIHVTFAMLLRAAQFSVICLTFSLLYFFVPNTKVRPRYALLAGLVAGALWVLTSWLYVKFQFGLARYTPFYSSFALFPLLMMWIYLSWLILLFGALLSFACQNEKTFAMERLAEGTSYAYREALAVRSMVEMHRRFRCGRRPWSLMEMAEAWNVPGRLLSEVLECLEKARLVAVLEDEGRRYLPARSPETTRVGDIVRAVREAGHDPSLLRYDPAFSTLYAGLMTGEAEFLRATVADVSGRLEKGTPHPEPDVDC